MTTTENASTLWVCTDCLYAAEGYDAHELGHDLDGAPDPEPLGLLGNYGAGNLTAGLMAEEHDEECQAFTDGSEYAGGEDCECDRLTFSWSPCDGCGSHLGGERHALTYWERAS